MHGLQLKLNHLMMNILKCPSNIKHLRNFQPMETSNFLFSGIIVKKSNEF
jgi:hypothetical protein